MINAILACDEQGGVSKNGTLPWPHNSEDLKWFKQNTTNGVVIMGSTTWKDPHMPRPLPNRINGLVTTKSDVLPAPDFYLSGDLITGIKQVEQDHSDKTIWIIGGPNIINQTLGIIENFYLSRIAGKYDCDTFLPLKKIETLFEHQHTSEIPGVEFQIWKRRTVK